MKITEPMHILDKTTRSPPPACGRFVPAHQALIRALAQTLTWALARTATAVGLKISLFCRWACSGSGPGPPAPQIPMVPRPELPRSPSSGPPSCITSTESLRCRDKKARQGLATAPNAVPPEERARPPPSGWAAGPGPSKSGRTVHTSRARDGQRLLHATPAYGADATPAPSHAAPRVSRRDYSDHP